MGCVFHPYCQARPATEISDLVERSFQRGPTLTRIIDRMVTAGLVTRARDAQDRRLVYIELTDRGRAAHAEATTRGVADITLMTETFSADELEQMNCLLHKLLHGMERVRTALHDADPHDHAADQWPTE